MTDLTFTGQRIVDGNLELQDGSITVSGDVTAGDDITATDDITAGGDITATTGHITATAGNIVATAGNITATAGAVSAGTTVTATTNISSGRHYLATGSAPTAAAGAQAGTSPPAPVVAASANDVRGNITFGTGGTSTAGAHVVVTFATAFSSAPVVMVIAKNTATEALGLFVSATSTTAFTLSTTGDSADSQANTVYSFDYIVIG